MYPEKVEPQRKIFIIIVYNHTLNYLRTQEKMIKKTMRKIFIILTTAIIAACGTKSPLQTASTIEGERITATFNDTTTLYFKIIGENEVALTWDNSDGKNYNSSTRYLHKGELVIPSIVKADNREFRVTSIDDYALYQQRQLSIITLPDGIKQIGTKAFSGCDKAASINIPEGVTTLDEEAFSRCKRITDITLPESIESIGNYCFRNCVSVHSVSLGKRIKIIPEGTFFGCASLKEITLPDNIESIGTEAFSGCLSLKNIELPATIDSLSDGVFAMCESLETITLPDGIKTIPMDIFNRCGSLKEIKIPVGVKRIDSWAFERCTSLANVSLNEELEEIGEGAFAGCTSLSIISLPKSIKSIESLAFGVCGAIKEIEILGNKAFDIAPDGALPQKPARIYVTRGCIDQFQFKPVWKELLIIEKR